MSVSVHVEDLIAHPTRYFDNPREVLSDSRLTIGQKRKVLESWQLDASRLAESTAENMSGGEESDLREVSKVLLELKSVEIPVVTNPRRSGIGPSLAVGALVGAGAGLVAMALTGPSIAIVAQTTVVGLIVGGVVGAVRNRAA
jgi:hypothetical protein